MLDPSSQPFSSRAAHLRKGVTAPVCNSKLQQTADDGNGADRDGKGLAVRAVVVRADVDGDTL